MTPCERCDYPIDGDHDCGKVIEMREQADAYRDALLSPSAYSYDCPGCGHPMHDEPCQSPVLTKHFEGTDHGGIVPCGHI